MAQRFPRGGSLMHLLCWHQQMSGPDIGSGVRRERGAVPPSVKPPLRSRMAPAGTHAATSSRCTRPHYYN